MGKFKIGDKVRVKNIEVGTVSGRYWFVSEMSKYVGKKFTIKHDYADSSYKFEGVRYYWAEDWLEPAKTETIVIYRNGDKTIALDKTTGKKAEAKCSKDDEYDFYVGAKIAFERLIGEDKAKEEPKPTLYNGKVVCITSEYYELTKGKIYEFKDGYSRYDTGDRMLAFSGTVESFEDLEKKMPNVFIKLVEE